MLKPGDDFCFARGYDHTHLAAHPAQIVVSIEIMGRRAWQTAAQHAGALYAGLHVRFRDASRPLVMHGICRPSADQDAASWLRCKFFRDRFQDVLASEIRIDRQGTNSFRVTASGDWKVLRRGREPDGDYGTITTDDRTFTLEVRPHSACHFAKGFWTADGPTRKLMDLLP